MDEPQTFVILRLHVKVLKYLLIWPLNFLNKKQNVYLRYGFFYYCLCTSFPVFSAAIYQFWVRIDDLKILLEALVGVGNITGYIIAYVCFLKKQKQIEELLYDFKQFIEFSELKLIEETERKVAKYTKYLLTYVTVGLMLNFIWQMFTTESCELQRGSEFYVKHDPCWMPVRNIYPFDASDRKYFWVVFPIESIYAYHISCFFSLATSTVMGFLMHISAQFKCCLDKFDHVFDDVEDNEISHNKKLDEFIGIIIYHQRILVYSQKLFKVFNAMIIVYISLTSLLVAVIGYQIVNPKINTTDRIKYIMLLIAWCLLVYLICYNGQRVQDDAVKIGQAIFKSHWYKQGVSIKLKKYIMFTIARSQRPLEFKAPLLGSISLMEFMRVMKWAYSGLTLILAVTADE